MFEETLYAETFKADYPSTISKESLALDAKNLRDGKLQNVAITIDKVMHVLKRMNTNQPPLRTLSAAELYEIFWSGENSIKESVLLVLDAIEGPVSEVDSSREFIMALDSE